MTERIWNSGPPPHIGWWNASMEKNPYLWRWWDGKNWSQGAKQGTPVKLASILAKRHALWNNDEYQWTDYWPKNARVPRIDPRVVPGG